MRRFTRLLCAVCAVCLLTGGAALAEEGCGIGEAAFTEFVREPAEAADPAGEVPESPAAAEQKNTAPAAGNPLETENSTRGFVYRMYRTVLGREPDKDGFSSWVKTLDEGIATASSILHPENASSPMALTLPGISTACREVQPLKARSPISSSPS